MQKTISSDFSELVQRTENYEFDPNKLDTIPITGILKKSANPRSCILVISSEPAGDLVVELEADDVVKHEVKKNGGPTGGQVTLHIRSTAIVTTSFTGKLSSSLVNSAVGQAVREPIPTAPWRIVSPFSRLDVLLNFLDTVDWADCRARGKRECEQLHPPGPNRDRCITDRYIACGPPPRLRVDEDTLEQLVKPFRGPIPS